MSHMLNAITLEVSAATDLVDREYFATVFALHHRNHPPGSDGPARGTIVPIWVLFGPNTIHLAREVIFQGTHFAVTGSLDYVRSNGDQAATSEFFGIRAESVRVYPPARTASGYAGRGHNGAHPQRHKATPLAAALL
jgi:hypothetical protein